MDIEKKLRVSAISGDRKMLAQRTIYWVSIIVFLCSLISCSEVQETSYPDKQAVVEDQAIERGWIPSLLPDSASKIYEEHDLDMNIGVGEFTFQERDERWLQEKLQMRPPASIRQQLITQHSFSEEHEVFIWEHFILSVDWEKNHVTFILPYRTTMQEILAQIHKEQSSEQHEQKIETQEIGDEEEGQENISEK